MTCTQMIELLLEADIADLQGRGDSIMARHLSRCPACRTIATDIVEQTRRLEAVIRSPIATPASPRRHRRRSVALAWAGAGIAALLLGLVRSHEAPSNKTDLEKAAPPTVIDPVARRIGIDSVHRDLIAKDVRTKSGSRSRPLGYPGNSRLALGSAGRVRSQPVTVTPITIAPIQPAEVLDTAIAELTVDPPAGTKAAVFRTTNPGITVVWLY